MGFPRQTVFSTLAVFAAVWLTGKFLLPLVSPFLLSPVLALAVVMAVILCFLGWISPAACRAILVSSGPTSS